MTRKFFGMLAIMMFVLAIVGCGTASSNDSEECALDPTSPTCSQEPADDPAEPAPM